MQNCPHIVSGEPPLGTPIVSSLMFSHRWAHCHVRVPAPHSLIPSLSTSLIPLIHSNFWNYFDGSWILWWSTLALWRMANCWNETTACRHRIRRVVVMGSHGVSDFRMPAQQRHHGGAEANIFSMLGPPRSASVRMGVSQNPTVWNLSGVSSRGIIHSETVSLLLILCGWWPCPVNK